MSAPRMHSLQNARCMCSTRPLVEQPWGGRSIDAASVRMACMVDMRPPSPSIALHSVASGRRPMQHNPATTHRATTTGQLPCVKHSVGAGTWPWWGRVTTWCRVCVSATLAPAGPRPAAQSRPTEAFHVQLHDSHDRGRDQQVVDAPHQHLRRRVEGVGHETLVPPAVTHLCPGVPTLHQNFVTRTGVA